MVVKKNVVVNRLVIHSEKGIRRGDAIHGAIALAMEEDRLVELIHNGEHFEIRPDDLVSFIFENKTMKKGAWRKVEECSND